MTDLSFVDKSDHTSQHPEQVSLVSARHQMEIQVHTLDLSLLDEMHRSESSQNIRTSRLMTASGVAPYQIPHHMTISHCVHHCCTVHAYPGASNPCPANLHPLAWLHQAPTL